MIQVQRARSGLPGFRLDELIPRLEILFGGRLKVVGLRARSLRWPAGAARPSTDVAKTRDSCDFFRGSQRF